MKKFIILVLLVLSSLQADKCEEIYQKAKLEYSAIMALAKTNVASFKAYEITNNFIDLSAEGIAQCQISKSFREQRELSINMQRASEVREKFKVLTFNELKQEALVQAKKEVECVNVYNNNTSIRRR
jgi:hypothetical protein